MATKNIKRGRAYIPPVWADTPSERLEWAMYLRGIRFTPAHDWATRPRIIVPIASKCEVDSRWLAVGVPSRAGAAAARQFCRSIYDQHTPLCERIERLLIVTPEPDLGAGVCRYCLCTDACGCAHGADGSCWWVDRAATICSACLEPSEE